VTSARGEPVTQKPNALADFDQIILKIGQKKPVLILDYDGTLTPIVSTPAQAVLADQTRVVLQALAKRMTLAVISGRDRADVQRLVGIDGIIYAGSHGFEIFASKELHFEVDDAHQFLDALDSAEKELKKELKEMPGALVERKKYGVAAHYRQVADQDLARFQEIVGQVHERHPDLRKTYGKKVIELQPKLDWNKGKALLWILQCLHFDPKTMIALYLGDDQTDEDAFKVLGDHGLGISVQEVASPTEASYTLKNPEEVVDFLKKVLKI